MPGGNPVTAEPGETPRLPVTLVGPVFVTVEPPRMAKFCAVPRGIWAKADEGVKRNAAIPRIARRLKCVRVMSMVPFVKAVRSEFDFLARCSHVASFAQPSVGGAGEGAVVLVAKERSGLAAPPAANDVGVPEFRIGSKNGRGDLFLVRDEILAAQDFACRQSNDLSGHEGFSGFTTLWRRRSARRDWPERRPTLSSSGTARSGSVTMNVDPRPGPALSARAVPPWSFTICATMARPMP